MIEVWTLAETAHTPIISPDGKWIIAGAGKATITDVTTKRSTVISKRGYVGGFYSNNEARLIDSDLKTIYILRKENNWTPVPFASVYNTASDYSVAQAHSGISQRGQGKIILDDTLLVNGGAAGCDVADNFLVFSYNKGEPRYWLKKYDIISQKYVDDFKPQIGANRFYTNYGYISYGYNSQCWIRTPTKQDQNITVSHYPESPAYIIKVGGAYWALSQCDASSGPFLVLRPLGDKNVIKIPFGAVRPNGIFDGTHFWITGATTSGIIKIAKIPLNEPRVPVVTPPIPIPPNPEPGPEPPMGLPTKVNDLWKVWNQRFPLPLGEENIRANTIRFCEQTNYQFPNEGWGTKSSTATNPISKDTVSQVEPANANNSNKTKMTSWDLVLGAGTTNPTPVYSNHGEYDTTNQYYRAVPAINHLGTPIPPNPEPEPPSDNEVLAELKKQTALLEQILELLEQQR